jgi:hypothetical protein
MLPMNTLPLLQHLEERMKFTGLLFVALLMTCSTPLRIAAQSSESLHFNALAACLDEFSNCDHTALTPQERQVVQRADRDRNFLNC